MKKRSTRRTDRKKRCWACSSELEANQKICLECKNWQSPRRHLVFSSTILSLVIALIAVGTPFVQKLNEILLIPKPEPSQFIAKISSVEFPKGDFNSNGIFVDVFMQNLGPGAAAVGRHASCSLETADYGLDEPIFHTEGGILFFALEAERTLLITSEPQIVRFKEKQPIIRTDQGGLRPHLIDNGSGGYTASPFEGEIRIDYELGTFVCLISYIDSYRDRTIYQMLEKNGRKDDFIYFLRHGLIKQISPWLD